MASVFEIHDHRPTGKSKATEYFMWSLKKIKAEGWDSNVSFYWHQNAVEYQNAVGIVKRDKSIFLDQKNKSEKMKQVMVRFSSDDKISGFIVFQRQKPKLRSCLIITMNFLLEANL